MSVTIDRGAVVTVWARTGIDDFYMAFYLEEGRFLGYSTFFCHQGLEKICKAYFLGTRAAEYESLPMTNAGKRIDDIAKNECGHGLEEMITKLINIDVLNKTVSTKTYAEYGKARVSGKSIARMLEKAYLETRYPVPNPVHENYPLHNGAGRKIGYYSPIGSSELREFAYKTGLEVLERVERDFNVTVPRENFSSAIADKDWMRFRRIFFKEDS
jgi:hypothetical protein